jgi:hypothetical protein
MLAETRCLLVLSCAVMLCAGCATSAALPEPASAVERAQLDLRPTVPLRRAGLPPHVLDLGYGMWTCERGYLLVRHRCTAHADLSREQVVVVSGPIEATSELTSTPPVTAPPPIEWSPFSASAGGWSSAPPDAGSP